MLWCVRVDVVHRSCAGGIWEFVRYVVGGRLRGTGVFYSSASLHNYIMSIFINVKNGLSERIR